ncbi:MAG: hypothetical protein ACKOBI_03500, partial [Bacteroidota bacterium]
MNGNSISIWRTGLVYCVVVFLTWIACGYGYGQTLPNQINGELRYDNPAATPLAGVPVVLKSLLGNIVAADTTDSSG